VQSYAAIVDGIFADHNEIRQLELNESVSTLRILKVCGNQISSLDVALLPNLRTLFADDNCFSGIYGLSELRKLENLSLRSQSQTHVSVALQEIRDIRRLYLTNNHLSTPFYQGTFPNITLLEISGTQLRNIPQDFAEAFPNCRVLILDNNFVEDLTSLVGMKRLKRLSVQGGQLEKARSIFQTLAQLPELEYLDLRANPVNLGFYPSSYTKLDGSHEDFATSSFSIEDKRYRKTLPGEWLARRSAYRALLIEASPSIRLLDGLKIGSKQRDRAKDLVERFANLHCFE